MAYTGQVTSGGPSDVRELPDVVIRKASVSSMDNNVYLLTDRATGEQLLVDAADDAPRLLALVAEGVPDGGRARDRRDDPPALGPPPGARRRPAARRAHAAPPGGTTPPHLPVAPDVLLDQGDTVTVGALTLDVVHLRGHTPGLGRPGAARPATASTHVFTGDSLFPGGVGNTDKDPRRFTQLIDDVEERLFGVCRTRPGSTPATAGHHARRRAPASGRVARARLVTLGGLECAGSDDAIGLEQTRAVGGGRRGGRPRVSVGRASAGARRGRPRG